MTVKISEKIRDVLFSKHSEFVYENFGDDVSANFGWVQDEKSFTTKIYSAPRQYVTSVLLENGRIEHEITSD